MALTFKTKELIALLDNAVKAKEDADTKLEADKAAARRKHQDKWWSEHKERVRALRDYLTKSLKNDTPPLTDEAKRIMAESARGYGYDICLFTPGGDSNVNGDAARFYRMDEIAGLSSLLKAHQGETVTAYQLKELGTHPKDLEKLFRIAVQAGVAVSK